MKEIKHKKKVFAKKVIDLGDYMIPREIDRTKEKHKWQFDVDIRSDKPSSQDRRWIYLGSHKTIDKCMAFIEKNDFSAYTDIRIVDSYTGEVLKQFKL